MYCYDEQNNWIHLLSLTQFAYQNSTHSVLKCSFFFIMYKYNFDLRYNIENNIAQKKMSAAKKRIKHVHDVRKTLIKRWQNVADSTFRFYNKKHLFKKFNEKNLIMLFIKNFKLKKFNKKLSNKFINSFKIVKIVKTQTYRLILFDTFKIYSIFYVSYLKSYKRRSNDDVTLTLFLSELIDNQLKWKIKKILKKKFWKKNFIIKFAELNISTNILNEFSKSEWKMSKNYDKIMKKKNRRNEKIKQKNK